MSLSSSVENCPVRSWPGCLARIEVSLTEKRTRPVIKKVRLVQLATRMYIEVSGTFQVSAARMPSPMVPRLSVAIWTRLQRFIMVVSWSR